MSTGADSSPDLRTELRCLLHRWDPIGVYGEESDWPHDEYDCMLEPLLDRLGRGDDDETLARYLRDELETHFGLDPAYADAPAFAGRVVSWYRQRRGSVM